MAVTYHNGISILQLIIYIPVFLLLAFLVHRHGLRKSSGFFFLNVFTQARIVGAAFDLATISNPSTIGQGKGISMRLPRMQQDLHQARAQQAS